MQIIASGSWSVMVWEWQGGKGRDYKRARQNFQGRWLCSWPWLRWSFHGYIHVKTSPSAYCMSIAYNRTGSKKRLIGGFCVPVPSDLKLLMSPASLPTANTHIFVRSLPSGCPNPHCSTKWVKVPRSHHLMPLPPLCLHSPGQPLLLGKYKYKGSSLTPWPG